jgi:capsular polysaccharide biosynthesis protein
MKLKDRNKSSNTKRDNYIKIINKLLKVSGKETRSIVNHKEFVEFIKKKFNKKKILNISLEYISIFDQYTLFNNAKIIFAQHGASLTNIIFMKPKTKFIEIIDKDKYNDENWFLDIGIASKIEHYQYITEAPHVKIDLEDFKNYLIDNNI